MIFRIVLGTAFAVAAASFMGCGGTTLATGSDGGTSQGDDDEVDASTTQHFDAGNDPDTSVPPNGCPTSPPANGSPCAYASLVCEYGTSPHIVCNDLVTCQNGVWTYPSPTPGPLSSFCMIDPMCPAAFNAPPTASTCVNDPDIVCDYPQGSCGCYPGFYDPDAGDPSAGWMCESPSPTTCSEVRPHLGTPCADTDQMCSYAACIDEGGDFQQCASNGVWVQIDEGCAEPGSTNGG
jgi:hypothetical protein